MATKEYAGRTVQLNDEGFMIDGGQWSPEIGEAIAGELGLALTPEHWKIINFCREDTATQGGQSPGPRRITQLTGTQTKDLYRLFPKGPGKLVARIAGLPKPKSCL
jgi:TusE/DsrC/DsvC family sulfur relay protein